MYQVKALIDKSWRVAQGVSFNTTLPYAEAIDLFDQAQKEARAAANGVDAIKLVEVGPAPDYRELNVLNYTEIRRKK